MQMQNIPSASEETTIDMDVKDVTGAYELQLEKLRKVYKKKDGHNTAVYWATTGKLLKKPFEKFMDVVENRKANADFTIIKLIRLLYTGYNNNGKILKAKDRIVKALADFPFWPRRSDELEQYHNPNEANNIVFWSENHILMILSSKYLLDQWLQQQRQCGIYDYKNSESLEARLLTEYLRGHCRSDLFCGTYEALSHVYLPYTISALLNLYDFAQDMEIKHYAWRLLEVILVQLMLGTTVVNGVCTFTASARAYSRTRLRRYGHNVNQIVNLIAGAVADSSNDHIEYRGYGFCDRFAATSVTDFLLTSSWRPPLSAYSALLLNSSKLKYRLPALRISHSTQTIDAVYNTGGSRTSNVNVEYPLATFDQFLAQLMGDDGTLQSQVFSSDVKKRHLNSEEMIPFFWSAGLLVHPEFIVETKRYQEQRNHDLSSRTHIRPLTYLFQGTAQFMSKSFSQLSAGQVYTGLHLNVYKESMLGLCLTSFERFNPHISGFQQLPWMANIGGLPVWTQSGSQPEYRNNSKGIFSALMSSFHSEQCMINTHNPWCSQQLGKGNVLVVSYACPASLFSPLGLIGRVLPCTSHLCVPILEFDEAFFTAHGVDQSCIADSYTDNADIPVNNPSNLVAVRQSVGDGAVYNSRNYYYDNRRPLPLQAGAWFFGRKDACYIGVFCTKATVLTNAANHSAATAAAAYRAAKEEKFDRKRRKKEEKLKKKHNMDVVTTESCVADESNETDTMLCHTFDRHVTTDVAEDDDPPNATTDTNAGHTIDDKGSSEGTSCDKFLESIIDSSTGVTISGSQEEAAELQTMLELFQHHAGAADPEVDINNEDEEGRMNDMLSTEESDDCSDSADDSDHSAVKVNVEVPHDNNRTDERILEKGKSSNDSKKNNKDNSSTKKVENKKNKKKIKERGSKKEKKGEKNKDGTEFRFATRSCTQRNSSWIVVVGTNNEHHCIEDFMTHCKEQVVVLENDQKYIRSFINSASTRAAAPLHPQSQYSISVQYGTDIVQYAPKS